MKDGYSVRRGAHLFVAVLFFGLTLVVGYGFVSLNMDVMTTRELAELAFVVAIALIIVKSLEIGGRHWQRYQAEKDEG